MIKHVVFDMGNVLFKFDPYNQVCRHYIEDTQERRQVCTAVFISPEWLQLDMGLLPEEEAFRRMASRLADDRLVSLARLCMDHWIDFLVQNPVEEMAGIVRDLKKKGYGIYLCSNASLRMVECKSDLPAYECFDGILFSSEVKCGKPQREMYEHFYRRFSLDPAECFFIDDEPYNVMGAIETGMDSYCFADRDIGKLKSALERKLFQSPS